MIAFDKSAALEMKPEQVWERFASQARSAADESRGTAPKFIIRNVSGSALGCRFEAGNPNRKLIPWEVVEWAPPSRFGCKSERPGRLTGYCIFFHLQIDPEGEERSRLGLRFSLVYTNPVMALFARLFSPNLSEFPDAEGLVEALGQAPKA